MNSVTRLLVVLMLWLPAQVLAGDAVYLAPEDFLKKTFRGGVPKAQLFWLPKDVRQGASKILGRDLNKLRLRYWQQGQRTAWILEEIGKEKPITVGLVVNGEKMEQVKVLIFRESRGWEVRYSFFTDQFTGARLTTSRQLDRHIDGISGATLSVRALIKLARLSLYLHQQVEHAYESSQ